MSDKSYQAADVRRKTADLLGEAAVAGVTVTIHCSSPAEQSLLYNALNVQRFRRTMSLLVFLHRDNTNCSIVLRPKVPKKERKILRSRTPGISQKEWAKRPESIARTPLLEDCEEDRAEKALKAHKKMVKEVGKKWKPLPPHEHPQLTSEPDDVAPAPVSFEWRRILETPDRLGDDVHYWCDADCRGFVVRAGVVPDRCPYCLAADCFARFGQVAPYLKEARKLRQERARQRRESTITEPKEDADD